MHCQSSAEAASKGLLLKALQLGLFQYTKGGVALLPVLLMRVQAQVQRADVSLPLALALQQPQQLLGQLLAPAEGAPEVLPPLKESMLLQLLK